MFIETYFENILNVTTKFWRKIYLFIKMLFYLFISILISKMSSVYKPLHWRGLKLSTVRKFLHKITVDFWSFDTLHVKYHLLTVTNMSLKRLKMSQKRHKNVTKTSQKRHKNVTKRQFFRSRCLQHVPRDRTIWAGPSVIPNATRYLLNINFMANVQKKLDRFINKINIFIPFPKKPLVDENNIFIWSGDLIW